MVGRRGRRSRSYSHTTQQPVLAELAGTPIAILAYGHTHIGTSMIVLGHFCCDNSRGLTLYAVTGYSHDKSVRVTWQLQNPIKDHQVFITDL